MDPRPKVGDEVGGGIVYNINLQDIHESKDVRSLFMNKRVLVFGGPAPFSRLDTQQAKEYAEFGQTLLDANLDFVYGIYCQDAFVMKEFDNKIRKDFPNHKVDFFGDGDGFFTRAHQLEYNFTFQGLSMRSVRYAMIVNNCIIEHVAIDEYQLIEQTSVSKILEWLDKSK
jgi:peroxiredoxin